MQTTLYRAARAAAAASSAPASVSRSLPILASVLVAGARSMALSHRASIQTPAFLSAISTATLITTTRVGATTGVVTAAPRRSFWRNHGGPKVSACKLYDTVLPSQRGLPATRQAKDHAWLKRWNLLFDTCAVSVIPQLSRLPCIDLPVLNFARPLLPVIGAHLLGAGADADGWRESATIIGTGARDFHSTRHVDGNEFTALDAGMTVSQSRRHRTLEQIANLPDLLLPPRIDGQEQFPTGASLPRGVKLEQEYSDWLVRYLFNEDVLGNYVSFFRNVMVHSPHLGKHGIGYIDGLFRIKATATSAHTQRGLYTTHAVLELKRDPRDLVAATVQGGMYLVSDTILNEMVARRKDVRGEPYATLLAIAGENVVSLMFSLEDLLRLREAMDTGVPCTPRVQALLLTGSGTKMVANPFQPTIKLNQPGGVRQMIDLVKRMWEQSIEIPDDERRVGAGAEEAGLNHVALAAAHDADAVMR